MSPLSELKGTSINNTNSDNNHKNNHSNNNNNIKIIIVIIAPWVVMSFLSGGSLPDSWSCHNFSRPEADGNFDGPVMDSIAGVGGAHLRVRH